MTTKFKVGDRVKYIGAVVQVVEVAEGDTLPYLIKFSGGWESRCGEDDLELIQPEVQEPVIEEPIPGKYYRTGDGDKLKFLMKGSKQYAYENAEGEILNYDTPTKYNKHVTHEMYDDIVGEWVDEVVLPAMEIKQWAIVMTTAKRGDIESLHDNYLKAKEYATCAFKDGAFEIVELIGILPERKVSI